MAFQFDTKARGGGGKTKAPSFGGGGSRSNPLELLITRELLGRQEEQRDIGLAGSKKAVTESTIAIGKLIKILPVLDEFEGDFSKAFPDAEQSKGIGGKISAGMTVFNARVLENDPELKAAIESLEGKRSQITKGLGEVGNLAEQEQRIAMQNVPELKFGGLGDLFLPESPAVGASKLRRFRNFVNTQIQRNLSIIEAGGDLSVALQDTQSSPIPGSPGNFGTLRTQADEAIASEPQRETDIRQQFKAMTGADL